MEATFFLSLESSAFLVTDRLCQQWAPNALPAAVKIVLEDSMDNHGDTQKRIWA